MRRRSDSIDGILQRIMTAAGILLALMILGKAIGMSDWTPRAFVDADSRTKAAQCLMEVWRYSYPAGKASEGGEDMSGWISFLWNRNPVLRYLAGEQQSEGHPADEDPAYETFLSSRTFYEEHPYLELYGDEESHRQLAEGGVAGDGGGAAGSEAAGGGAAAGSGAAKQPVAPDEIQTAVSGVAGARLPVIGTRYVMEQLEDYDFLMKHFYSVHTSTTATREEMDAETLLGKDMSMQKDPSRPQILIYHTHSQETYADWGPDNPDATVVGIGSYLTELLTAKGYHVIHHTGVYDLVGGKLDRSKAYTYALDGITEVLQQNPSVQVVLDLHRDGVKEGLHLVSEVNGKQTAPVMFFNGMSQTPDGAIEYLQNPYKEDNLAFSLKLQLAAAAYYPGFTRKIYLKGLRYNLHVRPKSALIEVGAQTNTYQEARNAMEPLAELLDIVLQGN